MGERSGEIIEPLLTDQWFMKMEDLAQTSNRCCKKFKYKICTQELGKNIF